MLTNIFRKWFKKFKKGLKEKPKYLDCLYNELQGSINSAFVDGDISEEQCDYLYDKYIWGNGEDDWFCKLRN